MCRVFISFFVHNAYHKVGIVTIINSTGTRKNNDWIYEFNIEVCALLSVSYGVVVALTFVIM